MIQGSTSCIACFTATSFSIVHSPLSLQNTHHALLTFLEHFHAVHHRLYVVYAYGAVYAHPVEGLVVDFCAFTLGIMIAGLTLRQGIIFNVLTVWKAMSDHCGYVLPWDPFVYLTANTSKYHDVHHQVWGLKVSQPISSVLHLGDMKMLRSNYLHHNLES